jgi:hypothetical protein
VVRFSCPSAKGEAQTQASAIRTSLLEWAEQLVDVSSRETAALVLDFNRYALRSGPDAQGDSRSRPGEFERVLEQVSYHGSEDLSVGLDRYARLDREHPELETSNLTVQPRINGEFFNEVGHQEWLAILDPLGEPHFGERTCNEIAGSHKAPVQDRPGASSDANVPGLDHVEGDQRRMKQVPQFMRKESEPLIRASACVVEGGLVPFAPVSGDRARDRGVKTAVEHPKVIRTDRHAPFRSQLRDRLTEVAVVMHYLRQGQSLRSQVMPVQERTPVNLRRGR